MDTEQYGALMKAIGEIQNEQAAQRRELLGNGQPGRVQLIEASVSELDKRVRATEKRMAWYGGGIAVVLALIHSAAHKLGF
jgi:hypothetical protein